MQNETAIDLLRQNEFFPKETFEEYLQKHMNKSYGKKFFFRREPDTEIQSQNLATHLIRKSL